MCEKSVLSYRTYSFSGQDFGPIQSRRLDSVIRGLVRLSTVTKKWGI